jgi:hypothetical protein
MIAHIRPPEKAPPTSPLVRARRMVAETLLPDRDPLPTFWQRNRKRVLLAGAILVTAAAALLYYWFR